METREITITGGCAQNVMALIGMGLLNASPAQALLMHWPELASGGMTTELRAASATLTIPVSSATMIATVLLNKVTSEQLSDAQITAYKEIMTALDITAGVNTGITATITDLQTKKTALFA